MKSSSGAHFIALDHIRALAAFLVFTWHFIHARTGTPIPFGHPPSIFPFALLDEGHTGVALFMTLSGYLFARLLEGKEIILGPFLWNRALRLLPLLMVMLLVFGGLQVRSGGSLWTYGKTVLSGLLLPSLPLGGWSLTVELHFYLLLPLLLGLFRKSKYLPLGIVLAAIVFRAVWFGVNGEVRYLAYWTMVGRIDQFVLGMLICQFRHVFAHRHTLVALMFLGFSALYWLFDSQGGYFHNLPRSAQSPSPIWILLPTIEGLVYAVGIAWYELSFTHSTHWVSRFVAKIGEYSYFIYLFHFFVVFKIAGWIDQRIMSLSNFYVACAWSAVVFVLMMPAGYLSYRFIETPLLGLRKPYLRLPTCPPGSSEADGPPLPQ